LKNDFKNRAADHYCTEDLRSCVITLQYEIPSVIGDYDDVYSPNDITCPDTYNKRYNK